MMAVDRDDSADPAAVCGHADGKDDGDSADGLGNRGQAEVPREIEKRGRSVRTGVVGFRGGIAAVRAGNDGVTTIDRGPQSAVRHQHSAGDAHDVDAGDDENAAACAP